MADVEEQPAGVSRRSDVAPFHVMRVWEAAATLTAQGVDVVNLSAGQPSTPAPAPVRAAAVAALGTERLGYTPAPGIAPLRAAIAGHYARTEAIEVDPRNVVVTTGSSGAFLAAFLAAFDVGDTVVMARPGYPAYRNMLTALGVRVVELDCGPQSRFQPTVDQLETLPEPPAGLVLASPANPTGTMVAPDELAAITTWCDGHGVRLISDEIYHGIGYGRPWASAWRSTRSAVVVNSFSKYWAMTGWRVGWLLVPDALLDRVDRILGNFSICPPAVSQYAAVAAFDPQSYAEADANVARYRDNRDHLVAGLAGLGIDRLAPADGAFYAYADIGHLTDDSLGFCADLLQRTGLALAPGIDFDPVDGHRFVRLCFAGERADLQRGLERLGAHLSG